MDSSIPKKEIQSQSGLFTLLKPYWGSISTLIVLTIFANALNLVIPKIISEAVDTYIRGVFVMNTLVTEFFVIGIVIFVLTYMQSMLQTYASERVARDVRTKLSAKISTQSYACIEKITPAKLLTNLTSDVDNIKIFVAQAISSIIASLFLIIGASILLLLINWKLALAILGIVPLIGVVFYMVLSRVRKLFKKSQEAIDWLNKVINESILGAALIRLLNSKSLEHTKFDIANTEAKNISLKILKLFAGLIPVITFATNIATIIILSYGGHLIMTGSMTLGDFTAFNSYLAILIFPILLIGIMSNVMAQANASYQRLSEILFTQDKKEIGSIKEPLMGNIIADNISVSIGEKNILKNISFSAQSKTRTAIIGPTAAGKTQLLYLLTGLLDPTSGHIEFDGKDIHEYDKEALHKQIGFVFQDSIVFNLSVRENIAFSATATNESLELAIKTAELHDFIDTLHGKLDTIISERGTSLSGGQKQRIMLARALALNPKVLLLDDFTARVDGNTEKKILENVRINYPDITLISVTQKIESVKDHDQILLLMEGEILARGTHEELMHTSLEYVQIYNSQQSTNHYEAQHA